MGIPAGSGMSPFPLSLCSERFVDLDTTQARNSVDAEFFNVCRATRGSFDAKTDSRFQAALEAYDNACRKALRLNLHDWDSNTDSIWNFCEDSDIKSIRAEVRTLRSQCTAEKGALKELQSEVIGWHRASVVDYSWLPRLKYQSHAVLCNKKMGKLFDVNSTAIKARKVAGALIATTAAQRELYGAYDQAHFGENKQDEFDGGP